MKIDHNKGRRKTLKQVLSLLFIFFSLPTCAQQPSSFKIGEQELAGVNIYDLLQDGALNYWIATDNGIYKYDYYKFKKIDCDEMTSASVFNLVEDDKGVIYCNNLSGQIFAIKDDYCTLYYQIPDSLMSYEITIDIDDSNQLTVLSNAVFQFDQKKKVKILYKDPIIEQFTSLIRSESGALFFFGNVNQVLFEYRQGQLKSSAIAGPGGQFRPALACIKETPYIFDQGNGKLIQHDYLDANKIESVEIVGPIFYTEKNNIWKASRTGGVRIYNDQLEPLFNEELVFSEYFISTLCTDKEDNILLGTFGDGLIVIPALETQEFNLPDINERAVQIEVAPNGSLFIGCRSGNVFELNRNGQTKLISDLSSKTIEYLTYLPLQGILIFDGTPTSASSITYNIRNEEINGAFIRSVKDIKEVDQNRCIVANNVGCDWFYPAEGKIEPIKLFEGRTNCVGFEKESKLIYAGSALGLKIGNEEQMRLFEIDKQPIICRHIELIDGYIYICTQKNGILRFQNGKFVDQWSVKTGLKTNDIYKLESAGENFVISTGNGVYLLSSEGETRYKFSTSIGSLADKPLDIEVNEQKLYIVYRDAIKIINLAKELQPILAPKMEISSWSVNDSLYPMWDNQLNYFQDKVAFEFVSKSLKFNRETIFHYQLSGIDKDWQTQPNSENKIEYKSLPAGKYVLSYYSQYENTVSETQVFSFSIAAPYWRSMWFFGLVILLFLSIVFISYRFQLRRQKKISRIKREMIESKLIAIQSQMNPHFIFNSLNSIQDLVLQQDGENAYNYISKFAFLVRRVLLYSEQDFIQFEDEVEVLQVYLELEQLRFEDDFEFEISVDFEEEVEIPPMVVQPFVENAIKHGLLHKDGPKKLSIHFRLEEQLLVAQILDNGVGRKRSKEINDRKAKGHQSFSTKSITSRLAILKNIYGGKLGVIYEDVVTSEGQVCGTKVSIKIPIRTNY